MATALVGGLAACARPTDGLAVAAASAFPDLSQYPSVRDGFHTENSRQYFSGSSFTTPDGQRCSTNVRDYAHRLWCYGPRPDKGGYWDTNFGPGNAATITPADPPAPDWKPDSESFAVLPAGYKIEMNDGLVCATGRNQRDGLLACRAGEHGFVFTNTSTRLF
jgi:hypothetical protein